jgi:hypothetical protein
VAETVVVGLFDLDCACRRRQLAAVRLDLRQGGEAVASAAEPVPRDRPRRDARGVHLEVRQPTRVDITMCA